MPSDNKRHRFLTIEQVERFSQPDSYAPDAIDSDVLEFFIYKAAMGFIRDGL